MDDSIDGGNILAQNTFPLCDSDDIRSLHETANSNFPSLACTAITRLLNHGFIGTPQNHSDAVYWHQRSDSDGFIDFTSITASQALRIIRALTHPYPGAWAVVNGKKFRIFKAEISCSPKIRGTPGKILYIQNRGPFIVCNDYAILIHEYLFEFDNESLASGQIVSSYPSHHFL